MSKNSSLQYANPSPHADGTNFLGNRKVSNHNANWAPGQPYCAPGYVPTQGPKGDCLCKFPQYSVAIPCGNRPPSCTPVDQADYGAVYEMQPSKHNQFHSTRYQS